MNGGMVIQGRTIGHAEIEMIRSLLAEHEGWHRTRLSRELCSRWEWLNAAGQPKDMACRSMLLKLERAGHIGLPARQGPSVNARRHRAVARVAHARERIEEPLRRLLPLDIAVAVAPLLEKIARLEQKIARLEKNSSNSSKPPSSDIVKPPRKTVKRKKGKRRKGAQPGHPRHERPVFTEDELDYQVT